MDNKLGVGNKVIKKHFNKYYLIKLFFVFLITVFVLSGCNKNNNEEVLNGKINAQLEYMENYILSMLNSFNNISYTNYRIEVKKESSMPLSDIPQDKMLSQGQSSEEKNSNKQDLESNSLNSSSKGEEEKQNNDSSIIMVPNSILLENKEKEIDWNNTKYEIENIYLSWNTLFVDLNSSNKKNKDTLEFTNILNDTTKSIKEEKKIETMQNLAKLYGKLNNYSKEYTEDNIKKAVFDTRSDVIDAYVFVTDSKWESSRSSINKADEHFGNVINNISQNKTNQSSINKSYVLIKEAEKAIDIKDKDIFYINYKMLMQELDNI